MEITKLKNKYKDYCSCEFNYISCMEVFLNLPARQYLGDVIIEMGKPFSTITFEKKETIEALMVLYGKFISGWNIENSSEFFIKNKEICVNWSAKEDSEIIEIAIEKTFLDIENLLEEKNIITVYHTDMTNWNYSFFSLVYPSYSEFNENDIMDYAAYIIKKNKQNTIKK